MGRAVRPDRGHLQPAQVLRKRRPRWPWALLAGMAAAILLVMTFPPPPPGTSLPVPPEAAQGRWTTGDARFADRAITVTDTSVSIGVGPDAPPVRGPVTGVWTWAEGGGTVVRIAYETPEGPQDVDLFLTGPGRMHLRNPSDVIWTR